MKTITTIRIEPELLDAVQAEANRNMRSRNAEICFLIQTGLKNPKCDGKKNNCDPTEKND